MLILTVIMAAVAGYLMGKLDAQRETRRIVRQCRYLMTGGYDCCGNNWEEFTKHNAATLRRLGLAAWPSEADDKRDSREFSFFWS